MVTGIAPDGKHQEEVHELVDPRRRQVAEAGLDVPVVNGPQLRQDPDFETGLLGRFAAGGFADGFTFFDEPFWKSPLEDALEGTS